MKQRFLLFNLILFCVQAHSQYKIEGQLAEFVIGNTVYLSIVEDFRKLSRVYPEQIFKKTQTDSLGYFLFEGNNISETNGIYRIHIDDCPEGENNVGHFFKKCESSKSVLFIANNRDSIFFERTFANEMFCDIRSTNPKSDAFLQINAKKEAMIFDFSEFRSEANRKLNTKKWFSRLQQFGTSFNEPLVELYSYDFLSDRRNETYTYYLNDIANNPYYDELADRLNTYYPNELFTKLYAKEIAIDKQLRASENGTNFPWKWILTALLALSIILNFWFWRQKRKNYRDHQQLTQQERKIVTLIKEDKTNKEIATTLFISVSTVKTHINNLYKKLGVSDRDEIKQKY